VFLKCVPSLSALDGLAKCAYCVPPLRVLDDERNIESSSVDWTMIKRKEDAKGESEVFMMIKWV
jgi:hypothetical protein